MNNNQFTENDIATLFKALNALDFRAYLKRNVLNQLKTSILVHVPADRQALVITEFDRVMKPSILSLSFMNPVANNRQFIDRKNRNYGTDAPAEWEWTQGKVFQAQNQPATNQAPAPVAPTPVAPVAPATPSMAPATY